MPSFGASRPSITPNTSNDNWTLSADTAGDLGMVRMYNWGGEATTSTAMATRWTRPNTNGVTATAGTGEPHTPGHATHNCTFATGWTTQPVLPAAGNELNAVSWNAHGGVGFIALPLSAPWYVWESVANQSEISCRNTVGTATSSYGLVWEEA